MSRQKGGRVSGGGESLDDRLRLICAGYERKLERKLEALKKQNEASQKEMKRELAERHFIGTRMSNLCFNLSQRDTSEAKIFSDLYKQWDAIRSYEHIKQK